MDYAFVPGTSHFDDWQRDYLSLRPNTTIVPSSITTVSGFLSYLERPEVRKPIRSLLIASHSSRFGWLSIDLDDQQTNRDGQPVTDTHYVHLDNAVSSRSIRVKDSLVERQDGTKAPLRIIILSCVIGNAPEFVDRLRDAFGPNATEVVAAKHYLVVAKKGYGSFNYFRYQFFFHSKHEKTTKQQIVDAFKAKQCTDIDGQPIPESLWSKFIPNERKWPSTPRNVFKEFTSIRGRYNPRTHSMIDSSVLPISLIRTDSFFQYRRRYYNQKLTGTPTELNTDSAKLARLKSTLESQDGFSRPKYPIHKKFGYDSVADFVDGWEWCFEWREQGKLFCRGVRHEYFVIIPVMEIVTDPRNQTRQFGHLFFRYHPRDRTNFVDPSSSRYFYKYSDSRFFYIARGNP